MNNHPLAWWSLNGPVGPEYNSWASKQVNSSKGTQSAREGPAKPSMVGSTPTPCSN